MLEFVILAAGKGSRMHSSLPKVLHPIAGKSLLGHVLDTVNTFSEDSAVNTHIVVGHGAQEVRESLSSDQYHFIEQTEQLGTGHAVQQALPFLNENSIAVILYGDVPLISHKTLETLIKKVDKNSLGLLTVDLENPKGYGRIVRDGNGHVLSIVEEKDANNEEKKITEANTGIMVVNTQHLQNWLPKLANNNAQSEYYLTDIIALAVQDGVSVATHQAANEWEVLGVNNRIQQAQLERIVQSNIANDLLEKGVTLSDPQRFDCRGDLSVGSDVSIDINCIFEGNVKLGDNVSIGANCILKNVSIGKNTVLLPNSIVEDSVVEEHCNIGPFARLRPGTRIANKGKIGNFVETKKAIIGEGSKVNHLSYVGDATLGCDVNVGAGTITCNYDGVNKHQTTIEDDVFVGSNSALVAPVTLGKNVTVAAGSVITKSVDDDKLVLTRTPQKTLNGWQRPRKK